MTILLDGLDHKYWARLLPLPTELTEMQIQEQLTSKSQIYCKSYTGRVRHEL